MRLRISLWRTRAIETNSLMRDVIDLDCADTLRPSLETITVYAAGSNATCK